MSLTVVVETATSATPESRRTSWFDRLNIKTHAELCFEAITWFALPPIERA